jgi:hypothetical protein
MSDEPKTIVAFKLKGGRTLKDLWLFSKLFSGFLLILLCIGLAQVKLCKDKEPSKPWADCLIRKNDAGK